MTSKGKGRRSKKKRYIQKPPSNSTLDSFIKESKETATVENNGPESERTGSPVDLDDGKYTTPVGIIGSISVPGETEISFPKDEITAAEASDFLKELKIGVERDRTVGIYFHNDMDGLNGAIFVKNMLRDWIDQDLEVHVSSLEYKELTKLKLDDGITYIFIDMDINIEKENVFRIDHHGPERDMKRTDRRNFILTPPENDYEYPSTATALCGYLAYISSGGDMTFFEYLNRGPWHDEQFSRILILLASVCDNLWHLNFLIDIPIKRWIPDPEEERHLVLISISASITLGEDQRREKLIYDLFNADLDPKTYLNGICQNLAPARNIMDFASQISREGERFYNTIFFNLTESIERSLNTLERDKDTYRKLLDSMPIDMKRNREKMMELLNTKGDLEDEHWRRIKFYGKELEKLEAKIKVEEKRQMRLRGAKRMISTDQGPRLCIMLPIQSSKQSKGIISSLLYYMGWKNVVIEERGSESYWGARGFSRETIDDLFSNLSLGYKELRDYLFMEKVFKDLPEVFKRAHNISGNISFLKTYSGGMGGRGKIFGGMLTGRVPWIFSILEETGESEEKIKELMKYKQLGSAMQGLTEGESTVSTAQALRAKFKSTGWLVVQMVQSSGGADIMLGNFKMAIMNLVGYNERISIRLEELPEPEKPMEHGRFDVVD
ncbi:MAG: hypothetical protein R6V01_02740 [Thermoplasmatota archaeon]